MTEFQFPWVTAREGLPRLNVKTTSRLGEQSIYT